MIEFKWYRTIWSNKLNPLKYNHSLLVFLIFSTRSTNDAHKVNDAIFECDLIEGCFWLKQAICYSITNYKPELHKCLIFNNNVFRKFFTAGKYSADKSVVNYRFKKKAISIFKYLFIFTQRIHFFFWVIIMHKFFIS